MNATCIIEDDDLIAVQGSDNVSELCTEIDDISGTSVEEKPKEYPRVVLEGVSTEAEIMLLRKPISPEDECAACPLYVRLQGEEIKIGRLALTLDCLLMLRMIGGYDLVIESSPSEHYKLDLDNPTDLQKFIRI